MRRRPNRRGYALMLVCLFVAVFLSLLGVAWRHSSSVVRVATVHVSQIQRDEGSLLVLAQALQLLETGRPPGVSYTCYKTVTTSLGTYTYVVTFTADATRTNWAITVAQGGTTASAPVMAPFGSN
jgi:hypothetical protein